MSHKNPSNAEEARAGRLRGRLDLTREVVRQFAPLIESKAIFSDKLMSGEEIGYPPLGHYAHIPQLVRDRFASRKIVEPLDMRIVPFVDDQRFVIHHYDLANNSLPAAGSKRKNRLRFSFLLPAHSWQALLGMTAEDLTERILQDSIGLVRFPGGDQSVKPVNFPFWLKEACRVQHGSAKWMRSHFEFAKANFYAFSVLLEHTHIKAHLVCEFLHLAHDDITSAPYIRDIRNRARAFGQDALPHDTQEVLEPVRKLYASIDVRLPYGDELAVRRMRLETGDTHPDEELLPF